jgi:hypothetical protein
MSRNRYFFEVGISHVLRFISICGLVNDSPSYHRDNLMNLMKCSEGGVLKLYDTATS